MTPDAQLLIAGKDNAGAKQISRENPVSKEAASSFAAADEALAAACCAAAYEAFAAWSETSPGQRRRHLEQAADALAANKEHIVETMVAEVGSTKAWANFNVMLGAEILREAAAMTTQISGQIIPANRPGTNAFAMRVPIGPMLGIAPWNAPVILAVRAIAMPLACGNTVILKGSELCPLTHRLVVDALVAGGLPEGVIGYINNAPEDAAQIVETLVTHPKIRMINFTGSTRVGRIIAMHAAKGLKPALLELGGKAPFVVLSDADLDEAAKGAAFGAFFNQGQICMSTERIIVDETIGDAFVSGFAERVAGFTATDPSTSDSQLGAVASDATVAHLAKLIEDAEQKGARVVMRGESDGTILQPSIIDGVTPDMRLWTEESFGPIVGIARGHGDEELIRMANDTAYGLAAAVYGRDLSRLMGAAKAIESGICHINGPTTYDEPHMPFGGVKDSGYGKFGGQAGIDSFTDIRWLTINEKPLKFPI